MTFQVESPNDSSINPVTVRALSGEDTFAEERMEADGTIAGVEVEDLNADGYPEVYIYVTSAGSGTYGSLIAYVLNRNRSISPISLPPLEDHADAARGYMGYYRFVVGGGSLVRHFPILQGRGYQRRADGRHAADPVPLAGGRSGLAAVGPEGLDF